jgi:hypothetical protein
MAVAVKARKEDVDYGPAKASSLERCGNCRSFRPVPSGGRGAGACVKVEGRIEARMWCKLWSKRA